MRARTMRVIVIVATSLTMSALVAPTADALTIERVPVPGVQPDNSQPSGEVSTTANGDEVVLFGAGAPSGSNVGNETWTFDGTVWHQEDPATVPPSRQASTMGPDPFGGGVLMYGGGNSVGAALADTWRWNPTTRDWELLCDPCVPLGRYRAGMVATPGDEVLLFGGATDFGFVAFLYRFDDSAGDWEEITIPAGPSGRGDFQMSILGDTVIVNGGITDSFTTFDDTWRLVPSGGTYAWELVCSLCDPGPRALGGIAPAFGGLLMFGGEIIAPTDPTVQYLSDVWFFDGSTWQLVEANSAPTPSEDEPSIPYWPLLATFGDGALLVENHSAEPAAPWVTRSFLLQQPLVPPPAAPVDPIVLTPTFTG